MDGLIRVGPTGEVGRPGTERREGDREGGTSRHRKLDFRLIFARRTRYVTTAKLRFVMECSQILSHLTRPVDLADPLQRLFTVWAGI